MDVKPLKEPVPAPTAVGENEALLIQRVIDLERRIRQLERGTPEISKVPTPTEQPSVTERPVGVRDVLFLVKQLDERLSCLEHVSAVGVAELRRHLLGMLAFIETQQNFID